MSSLALASCGDNLSADPAYVTMARPQIMQLLAHTQTSGAVVFVESPNGNWSESFGTAQSVVWATSADSPDGTAPADAIGKLLIAALGNENIVADLDEIKP
ncbi:hypothetical protein [Paraburkholderia sp. HD33-4]|uniref:hypothetical protein n=1 Tax=Paraburkholderia sp. HD33-4 TaxID=2883242 RepID=UPI001F2DF4D7|nr:hypothetical protein [Paraburkholderia sp. HD33-4]